MTETLFKAMVEAAPDAIILINEEGSIVLANRQAEEMFGYSREELLGNTVEIFLPPALQEKHKGHRLRYFSDPKVRPMGSGISLKCVRKDGSSLAVEISLSPLHVPAGRLAMASVRDVSERRQIENDLARYRAELERSNLELEQFAYVISHDLQAPLRGITGFTQLLSRHLKNGLDETASEYMQMVVDSAGAMHQQIDDLLAYSRVGRSDARFEKVDLNNVLEKVLLNLTSNINQADASIEIETLPTIHAIPALMVQFFQNLIANAIKFSDKGNVLIRITALQAPDGGWSISVQDNGIGISPENHERIFKIFQRLHTTEQYEGTGIGLAICQRVAHRHHGRLVLESKLGQGSTFTLHLPHGEIDAEGLPLQRVS